jgi:hypothetical protein
VEGALADYYDCVFDFGAGHSTYDDPVHLARARQALAPFANVVLVLPSPDPAESVRVLHARRPGVASDDVDLAVYAVAHPANWLLARHVVYTESRVAEETRDEILHLLRVAPPH